MNKTDRRRLERLYKLLKIPKFAAGTQSACITGIALYARDCAYALPMVQDILYAIGSGDPYCRDPDELLDEFEDWFNKRRAENWQKSKTTGEGVFV